MRKELLVAICAGTLFGVLAAFGIWKANKNFKVEGMATTPTNTLPSPSVKPDVPGNVKIGGIELLSPIENDVVVSPSIVFSGKTHSNVWLTISTDSEDKIIKTKEDGTFFENVTLATGINLATVTVFPLEGLPQEQSTYVTYSNTFPEDGSGKPKAYIGIVTDKTENSLQIKDTKGMILLLTLDPQTAKVVKLTGTTLKDATYTDVAIGDSIAGLGYVESSNVLNTRSIILTPVSSSTSRKTLLGTVTSVTRKVARLKVKDGTEYSFTSSNSLSITAADAVTKAAFSDLEVGQNIIATGTLDGTNLAARKVQILP